MVTINHHVERLLQHQPFDPELKELFAESSSHDYPVIRTSTQHFLLGAVKMPDVQLIVLTGDAGHGKTHLCAQLIAELTSSDVGSEMDRLKTQGYGEDVVTTVQGRGLRVVKDLSEATAKSGGALLEQLLEGPDMALICANEGHLRQCLRESALADRLTSLDDCLAKGSTSWTPDSIVVDLNHQSTMAGSEHGSSITAQLLDNWLAQRHWAQCDSCAARKRCPILANRSDLSDDASTSRPILESLVRVAERMGATITIRDVLIFIAHAITGDMSCADVQQKNNQESWQYLLHQNVFGDHVPDTYARASDVFRTIRRLDPQHLARRDIDASHQKLVPRAMEPERPPETFGPESRKDDRERLLTWFRFARRRSLFTVSPHEIGERIGLADLAEFEDRLDQDPSSPPRAIVQALERAQGLPRSVGELLAVVEPSQILVPARVKVLCRQVPRTQFTLGPVMPEESLREAVDNHPRKLELRLGDEARLELNAEDWTWLRLLSRGMTVSSMPTARLRRLQSFLMAVGEKAPPNPDGIIKLRDRGREVQILVADDTIMSVG